MLCNFKNQHNYRDEKGKKLTASPVDFKQNTVSEHQYDTPSREERCFLYFNHLSKEFLEQMIPHLKALI